MSTELRPRQLTLAERNELFPLDYEVHIERNGKPEVRVPMVWEGKNLVRLRVPNTTMHARVHKSACPVFERWFESIEQSGYAPDILTYDGSFNPRLERGVEQPRPGAPKTAYDKLLSNHSRGTAIDLNARWNPMGVPYDAAKWQGQGDLAELIHLAWQVHVKLDGRDYGIVCGAHWKGASIDCMHFEIGVWP